MHPGYPYLLPAFAAVVAGIAAAGVALSRHRPRLRAAAAVAAVGLFLFAGFGSAKTYAAHYKWICVTHHHDMCNNDGDDPGPTKFGLWMVRHFG